MITESLRVLYVEDDRVDQLAFGRHIEQESLDYRHTTAGSVQEALQHIQNNDFDIVISDYRLGDGTALELLKHTGTTPFIVVTGMGDEEVAVSAIKQGAYDYLIKDPDRNYLKILPLAVDSALAHQAAKQALKESEARFQIMADTAPVMIWMSAADGLCTYFNKTWLEFTGRQLEHEAGNGWAQGVHAHDRARCLETYHQALAKQQPFSMEYRLRRHDGQYRWLWDTGSPRRNESGDFVGYIGSCIDITERKEFEDRQQDLLTQIESSHEDLLSILGQLRLGVVMTDDNGAISFVSRACQRLLNKPQEQIVARSWERVCPFAEQDKARLKDMAERPATEREKVAVEVVVSGGQHYCMDIEVQDDPRNPRRKIFFMYDMTAVHDLRRLLNEKASRHGMVGKSPPMQVVYEQIQQLSKLDTTVLIEGETGTGKELAAQAIHGSGHRKDKPFIALNCAGLTESLLASQLFGHKRGSFTGAVSDQPGHFEAANGGTLFLDEIGDISTSVQTSLLRVLQEREIIRLGETKPRKIDVRIIAATHRDLNKEVEEGRFRQDLLYRIRVARITLPPLRARRTDIPLLAQSFLKDFCVTSGKEVERIGDLAMRLLTDHHWPGNVRELNSAIEFAAIRCQGQIIKEDDLPPEIFDQSAAPHLQLNNEMDEKDRIVAALQETRGNRSEAAHILGMSRSTFYRRLSELNIETSERSRSAT